MTSFWLEKFGSHLSRPKLVDVRQWNVYSSNRPPIHFFVATAAAGWVKDGSWYFCCWGNKRRRESSISQGSFLLFNTYIDDGSATRSNGKCHQRVAHLWHDIYDERPQSLFFLLFFILRGLRLGTSRTREKGKRMKISNNCNNTNSRS